MSTLGPETFQADGVNSSDFTMNYTCRYKVIKRAAPTVVCYDLTTGAADSVTMPSGAVAESAVLIGDSGFLVNPTNGAASTSRYLQFHWTADAEL